MTIHIAGAGLAGLAAAVTASQGNGGDVVLHETSPRAGGRCRSFDAADPLGRVDNGAHVVLGANRAAFAYLDEIGARDRLMPAAAAAIPFVDLATGAQWRVAVARRLWRSLMPPHEAGARVLSPFLRAAFNAPPARVPVRDALAIARRLACAGPGALRPWIARTSLHETFIRPALDVLASRGVRLAMNDRLTGIAMQERRATSLAFTFSGTVALGPQDAVVLAVPPHELARLLPGSLTGTPVAAPIVNVHFALSAVPPLPGGAAMLGLAHGTADWLFRRGNVLTCTASAAAGLVHGDAVEVARLMWRDAQRALGLVGTKMPPYRVIKERQATWDGVSLRRSALPGNIFICGDSYAKGLPCTIEAALISGQQAGRQATQLQSQ